jgi:hypothetical protein
MKKVWDQWWKDNKHKYQQWTRRQCVFHSVASLILIVLQMLVIKMLQTLAKKNA